MSKLTVQTIRESDEGSMPIFEEVQRRAYDLFERRGSEPGHDVDDWLQAEREIMGSSEGGFVEPAQADAGAPEKFAVMAA
jgi:hypothetical protein